MTEPQQPNGPPELADDQLTPTEQTLYVLILAAIVQWLAAVRPRVLAPVATGFLPDATAIFAFIPLWTMLVDRIVGALRTRAVVSGTQRLRQELTQLRIPDLQSTDSFVNNHLAQVKNYLVRIPDEVFQLVREAITDGVSQGEDVRAIAARVDQILTQTGSENWPARAKVIAITEVNGAANAGWYASAVNAQKELGIRLDKVWLAAHDNKVRPSHRAADGQRRGLTEPFMVGGWPLLYPGDKNGPPEEVINCRCAAATKETRNG